MSTEFSNKEIKHSNGKPVWYWVTGNVKKGFTVVTKRPKTKEVMEPHNTERKAYVWIANFYSLNA